MIQTAPGETTEVSTPPTSNRQVSKRTTLVDSGIWIGLLSMMTGIVIAAWLLNRVPRPFFSWGILVFVAWTAFPYFVIGLISPFVSSPSAKVGLAAAWLALLATTMWQFSLREAQAAIIIFYQIPGSVGAAVLILLVDALANRFFRDPY